MVITQFYNLISEELLSILRDNSLDEKTKTHKKEEQNKSYALLVWFLQFYGQKPIYKSYITDGTGDNSCDIIFANKNFQGEDIFYVVQSKYVNFDNTKTREEAYPKIDKKEFGSTLNDFNAILSGARKLSKNTAFNEKYEQLKKHLDNNGKVKFVFFTLAKNNEEEVAHSVEAFNKNYAPNIALEIIDIDRIRRDYIEFKYKEVKTSNPLEYNYNSEDSAIELPIERFKDSKRDIFEFVGRSKAFTFLLKPKTIHELFKKFRFSLFFKNVRNPIHRSNYNPKIIDTLLNKPDAFWYFNNGITAITKILPDVGVHAKKIAIEGLQIINGAQTVYSVYSAYENASPAQRKAMDAYAKIALRLIGSSDNEFNLQITRYTNMQNPMHDRDFWANDEIQQKLQNESFYTDLWYEKRRDEFQLNQAEQEKLGIKVVSNVYFILPYIAFHLQEPTSAMGRINDFFVSIKDSPNGLYEEIFDPKEIKFENMYAALWVWGIILAINSDYQDNIIAGIGLLYTTSISKIVIEKYYAATRPSETGKEFNVSRHILTIIKTQKKEELAELQKILMYSDMLIQNRLLPTVGNTSKPLEQLDKLMSDPVIYYVFADKVKNEPLDIEKIQAIEIVEITSLNWQGIVLLQNIIEKF
jgi:hypothetical protein